MVSLRSFYHSQIIGYDQLHRLLLLLLSLFTDFISQGGKQLAQKPQKPNKILSIKVDKSIKFKRDL